MMYWLAFGIFGIPLGVWTYRYADGKRRKERARRREAGDLIVRRILKQ